MDINDYTPFAPQPEAPAEVPAEAPAEVPAPRTDDSENKKEKSVKQQLTSFGITMVVICFVMSLLAGAGGAYAMLNFYPLISGDKTDKTTEITEGEYYQIPFRARTRSRRRRSLPKPKSRRRTKRKHPPPRRSMKPKPRARSTPTP